MKAMKFGLVGIGLVFFLIWLPDTALADAKFYIGIGVDHHPSGFSFHHNRRWHASCFPRHRPDVFRRWPHYRQPYYYRQRPVCLPGPIIWERDWYPRVMTPPVIVEVQRPIIIEREVAVETEEVKYDEATIKLYERLRKKKNELLEKLKSGNKEVIAELAGFSFDDGVRKTLEDILISDPDPELRKEAIRAFAKVKNRGALPTLEKARVEDPDIGVRKEADRAIKEIREY